MKSRFVAVAASAGAVCLAQRWLRKHPLPSWDRTSFDSSAVSLSGGLSALAGIGATILSAGTGTLRYASTIAVSAGALAGYIDDHLEDAFAASGKGFHGHLGALKSGRLTSGVAKIVIIGAGSFISSCLIEKPRNLAGLSVAGVDAAIIAGGANLINLLDLRPGRAVKAVGAAALPLVCTSDKVSPMATGVVATCVACAPRDLAGHTMLGDLGANALGAQLGVLAVSKLHTSSKVAVLAVIVGLTGLSEKVSFSKIIDEQPFLRTIDRFGRA